MSTSIFHTRWRQQRAADNRPPQQRLRFAEISLRNSRGAGGARRARRLFNKATTVRNVHRGGGGTAAQGLTAADVMRAALTGAYVARRPSMETKPPAGMLKPLSHRVTLTQWLMLHQHHVSFCVCV